MTEPKPRFRALIPSLLVLSILVIGAVGYEIFRNSNQSIAVKERASQNSVSNVNLVTTTPAAVNERASQNSVSDANRVTTTSALVIALHAHGISTTGYSQNYHDLHNTDGSVEPDHLLFVSPDKDTFEVPDAIAMRISSPIRFRLTGNRTGEQISANFMPLYPDKDGIIIVSTNETICTVGSSCATTNRFYSYNLRDAQLKLLFTAPVIMDKYDGIVLRPIATQGSKVILISHRIGTGGVCDNNWAEPADMYSYIDVEHIAAGKSAYAVPAELTALAQEEERRCHAEL